jgi:purine-binding chemotaxis protein CheW
MRGKRKKDPLEETGQKDVSHRDFLDRNAHGGRQATDEQGFREFAVFTAADSSFGIDIMHVREIIRPGPVTMAPLAPPYVLGVFNLRGQIITVIDLSRKLALERSIKDRGSRYIVVEFDGEKIGIHVDRVQDVVEVPEAVIEKAPAGMRREHGNLFSGVIGMKDRLVGILNLERLLGTD